MYRHGLELRSKITSGGFLELFLQETPVPEPAADEIVIQIEAAPLNPSDIILLLSQHCAQPLASQAPRDLEATHLLDSTSPDFPIGERSDERRL